MIFLSERHHYTKYWLSILVQNYYEHYYETLNQLKLNIFIINTQQIACRINCTAIYIFLNHCSTICGPKMFYALYKRNKLWKINKRRDWQNYCLLFLMTLCHLEDKSYVPLFTLTQIRTGKTHCKGLEICKLLNKRCSSVIKMTRKSLWINERARFLQFFFLFFHPLIFLQFHPSILEPDFYLSLG